MWNRPQSGRLESCLETDFVRGHFSGRPPTGTMRSSHSAPAEKVWIASRGNARGAKTVGLKLKTKQFASLSRSLTVAVPLFSCEELVTIVLSLCGRVDLGPQQLFGLVGVGLSNFQNDTEDLSPLFTGDGSLVVEYGPLVETGELEP